MKHELSVAERVDNGIKLLDEKGPANWRDRINNDSLNVDSLDDCPLSQIYGTAEGNSDLFGNGGYNVGREALGIRSTDELSIAHGFERHYDFDTAENDYYELTVEWNRRLTSDS